MSLAVFDLANQRLLNLLVEDSFIKSRRGLPSGRRSGIDANV